MKYRLGRSIATIIPFVRVPKEQAIILPNDVISNKIIVIMAVVAVVKIAVLFLWI